MDALLVNELRVLRDACAKVQQEPGNVDLLDDVVLKLNLMIVDRAQRPEMEAVRQRDLPPVAAMPVNEGDRRAILARDHAFWRDYTDAVSAESTPAPGDVEISTGADQALHNALTIYLRAEFPEEMDLDVTGMSVMTEGYSKKTYLVSLSGAKRLPDTLVVRSDQASYVPTTVRDEYDLLCLLHDSGVPVPPPIAIERTGDVLGNAFMVVGKVEGRTVGDPYRAPPADERLTRSTAEAMARIHAMPLDALAGIGLKGDPGHPHILGDFEKYERMWSETGAYCPTIDVALAWVRDRLDMAHSRAGLVHNDFSYNNMLVQDGRVTAVLDWEFAHIGNPAADLAYHKYVADQMSGFGLFKQCYAEAGGVLPSDAEIDFYYIWGMTRLGIMIFQAQALFDDGGNLDLRFAVASARYLRHPMLALGKSLEAAMSASAVLA